MNSISEWLKKVYLNWFPWLKPCSFRIFVRLTTEIPTATVPSAVSKPAEPIRTLRHFEVTASSLEEAKEIALENARLAFQAEGYQVRDLLVTAAREITS
jgi:hypothetical protein